jgi:hypothetical protein
MVDLEILDLNPDEFDNMFGQYLIRNKFFNI